MKKLFLCLALLSFLSMRLSAQERYIYTASGNILYLHKAEKSVLEIVDNDSYFTEKNVFELLLEADTSATKIGTNRFIAEISHSELFDIQAETGCKILQRELLYKDSNDFVWLSDRIFVRKKEEDNIYQVLSITNIQYNSVERIGYDENLYLVSLKEGNNSLDVSNQLFSTGFVDYSVPDFGMFIYQFDNPLYDLQWNLNDDENGYDITVEPAWEISDGDEIKVAIIDCGVELDHPDLEDNILPGYNCTDVITGGFIGGNYPGNYHGTCCAGIVAAIDNNIGIKGIAYKSKIIPIRIYDEPNSYTNNALCYSSWILKGIYHSWSVKGADILSCSWGYGSLQDSLELIHNEIDNAMRFGRNGKGCVVVFAAGNHTVFYPTWSISAPATYAGVIAVGAMSPCAERKNYQSCDAENWGSRYGSTLSVVAPGVFIPTTTINHGYKTDFNGTSSACPHVSAIAALILSKYPHLTASEVKTSIELSARKIGNYNYNNESNHPNGTWNNEMGYGLVNAYDALQYASTVNTYAELYIRDNALDDGYEPNTSTSFFYNSPDIWLTDANNNIVLIVSDGQSYNVHVRITNKSPMASFFPTLHVKWVAASTNFVWSFTWNSFSPLGCNPTSGDVVLTTLGLIGANSSTTITIPWTAPVLNTPSCMFSADKYSFAAIISDGHFTVGENMVSLSMPVFVSSNNNVAWKHVLRATNTKSSLLTENRVEVDKLQVIPNPTNGITKIVYLLPEMVEKATIEILSEDGIMVYKTIVERTNTTIQLDLSPFSSGLYSVRLIALGKIIETKSLIIK